MDDDDAVQVDIVGRIVIDPEILVGRPVVRGTRIAVSMILGLVAHEVSFDEIVEDYPVLTKADIRAAILYAGDRLDHGEVDTPPASS